MGVSTYYLGLPRSVLDRFRAEPASFQILMLLWHDGSGAWTAVDEVDRDELTERVTELQLDDEPETALQVYEMLVAESDAKHPTICEQRAYVENTHRYHEAMLRHWFRSRGVGDAERLAGITVAGGGGGEMLHDLWCTHEPTVRRIGDAVRGAEPIALMAMLPELEAELAQELDGLPRSERSKLLQRLATDEDVAGEMEDLLSLYEQAARLEHVVLLG